jgi:four helix bundle protein
MQFKRFEEMPVWQDARKLTTLIYTWTQREKFARDFGLRDQIQRSAVSIMSNIAEGYERATRKDFLLFISYAKGSVGEVRSQLYIGFDLKYIDEQQFKNGYDLCVSISTQLSKFSQHLKSTIESAK